MTQTNRLLYLALGGAGEIGMNCYLYGYGPEGEERFILVDVGIAFPDMDTTPGVDVIFADVSWIADRADRLEGIFITHAHEDHVGGLGHLYRHFPGVPVYARPFTANHARRKLAEQSEDAAAVEICAPRESVLAGPFSVSFLPISHSIPESSALVIDTPEGRVIHTGDFKLDPSPVIGDPFDEDLWAEAAKPGVRALVCDSTNVFSLHEGRSEAQLGPEIRKLIAAQTGMVVATTFASNIARLKTLADAAVAAGRSVCLLGRAMRRMVEAAVEEGVLTEFPKTVSAEEANLIPRENLMLLVTGSQGERQAASAQLSRGKYLGLELSKGDTFFFSSKTIPGNEKAVAQILNNLSEMGVTVVTEADGFYHVSGHANRPDLERIMRLVKPQCVVPMHGEHRHLRAHVQLAEMQGHTGILAPNGTLIDLAGNAPSVVAHIETGRVYLDGSAHVGQFDGVLRDRIKLAVNGHVVVAVVIDEDDDILQEAWVDLRGLPELDERGEPLADLIETTLGEAMGRAQARDLDDEEELENLIKRRVRAICQQEIGKKPEVTTLITRLMAE